jgi:hypothetical protein
VNGVDVVREVLGRVATAVPGVLDGLSAQDLLVRPGPDANPIGWLVWHLARVEDAHVAEVLEQDQLWETGPWAASMGLEPDPSNSGYGHTTEQVAAIRSPGTEVLQDYFDQVRARTEHYLDTLSDEDLDRVVDRAYDPPVTLGVRLVSIAEDGLQHIGQAAYVKGLLPDRR